MSAGGGGGSMRQKGGYEGGQDESVSGGGGCSHRTRQLLLDDRTHGDSGPSVSGCSGTRRAGVCMYMCLSAVCCLCLTFPSSGSDAHPAHSRRGM